MIARYPLTWPAGQPRTPPGRRRDADFKVDLGRARDELLHSLQLLGGTSVVLSTNIPLRQDGLPYANWREPDDGGVAVYFDRAIPTPTPDEPQHTTKRPFVIACDTYRKVRWNLRAIGATVEALRAIQRHGASSMLEQAFTGFAALPQSTAAPAWWDALGVPETADAITVREAYRELARIHHPDAGGDHARMAEINRAFDAARREGRA
ncbi:MAG: DnaJ domain protein [Labilithrix sp.]|nr:DnaJ domain protein [Labilithrix sp.]